MINTDGFKKYGTEETAGTNDEPIEAHDEFEAADDASRESEQNSETEVKDMTTEEMIAKIMERTGATREQAQDALNRSGGDLLDAVIFAERTYGQASRQSAQNGAYGSFNENKTYSQPYSAAPAFDFNEFLRKARMTLKKHSVIISYNGAAVGTLPLVVCIIAMLLSLNSVLVIMIAAMFFNVSYSISGTSKGVMKVNLFLNTVYSMVQTFKKSFSENN